ncbi:hypothetical protein [Streptomyces sp. MA5143a]|uniref:hypothetical protein n=1 Tax=Streptomyces sp. MA5143a TaxID=2083010 RepID=UPI000D2A28C7|nr:hypothetical protein [Streptomyces sp. MA5143a]SPF06301.1 hypothetical protein SMA5143A_7128 [Streptomyces sp. MA5143a]
MAAAGLIAGLVVACGPKDLAPGESGGSGKPGKASKSATPTPAKTPGGPKETPGTPTKTPSSKPSGTAAGGAKAVTCAQLQNASLDGGGLEGYGIAGASLSAGRWEGPDGVVIELQPQCAIGDITGDGAADAVGALKISTGGTGKFYTLVTWRNDGGTPVPAAAAELGDRTPVVSIDFPSAGPPRQVTVVYRTRGDDDPAAVVTLTRTAVYEVSGASMVELHHSDAPYTP